MPQPTRADQVRMASSASSKQPPRRASMTAIDMEDDNLRPDAWFAYVMPTQSGVEMMGSGRYGFWAERPNVYTDDVCIRVVGADDEPIFVAPKASVVSVHVATAKHISAFPIPIVEVPEQQR